MSTIISQFATAPAMIPLEDEARHRDMTMTSKRAAAKNQGIPTAAQVRRLRQALDLFAAWSDCLQRAHDPDALVSCLCRALTTTGNYALSAARALIDVEGMDAEAIARKAMKIAADICVYTNHNLVIEKL